jgi:transposase InsO family protein
LRKTPKSPLHPIQVGFRGEILAMDLMGGKYALPVTPRGNKYILVMVDLFTRYACAVALPDQCAGTVCDAVLSRFFLVFGAPFRILTDRGANFESAVFSNLCTLWRVAKVRTTAYHPAGNGACERLNQTLKKGLQKALNEENLENWDAVLAHVVFAYNTSIHSSTGFTPYFLMYGQEAKTPCDFVGWATAFNGG